MQSPTLPTTSKPTTKETTQYVNYLIIVLVMITYYEVIIGMQLMQAFLFNFMVYDFINRPT